LEFKNIIHIFASSEKEEEVIVMFIGEG